MTGPGKNVRRKPGNCQDPPGTESVGGTASAAAGPGREAQAQLDELAAALARLRDAAAAHDDDLSLT
jgi:hypothetical protein